MKKIVSLLSAVAMLAMLAVPASAALTYDNSMGAYVISEFPTTAEVAEYAPTMKTTVVKAESLNDLNTWGGIALKLKYNATFAQYDIYKITYDMANIGTFVNGYNSEFSPSWFGLYDITVSFDGSVLPADAQITALKYTLPNGTTGNAKAAVDKGNNNLNAIYTAAGATNDTIYPVIDGEGLGVVSAEGTYKVEYVLALKAGTSLTIPYVGTKITYSIANGANTQSAATTKIVADAIVLGSGPVVPTYELVNEYDLASGYGWDVLIKNFDSEKTYTAKFTNLDDAEDTRPTATINGLAEIAETDGDVAFAALIRLTNGRSNIKFEIEIQ